MMIVTKVRPAQEEIVVKTYRMRRLIGLTAFGVLLIVLGYVAAAKKGGTR